jgi:hypothetical protein
MPAAQLLQLLDRRGVDVSETQEARAQRLDARGALVFVSVVLGLDRVERFAPEAVALGQLGRQVLEREPSFGKRDVDARALVADRFESLTGGAFGQVVRRDRRFRLGDERDESVPLGAERRDPTARRGSHGSAVTASRPAASVPAAASAAAARRPRGAPRSRCGSRHAARRRPARPEAARPWPRPGRRRPSASLRLRVVVTPA